MPPAGPAGSRGRAPGQGAFAPWSQKLLHFLASNWMATLAPFLCFVVYMFSRDFYKPYIGVFRLFAPQQPPMYGSMHILKSISSASITKSSLSLFQTVKILIPTHRAWLAANITFVVDCDPKICQIWCFYHKVHSWSLSSPTRGIIQWTSLCVYRRKCLS